MDQEGISAVHMRPGATLEDAGYGQDGLGMLAEAAAAARYDTHANRDGHQVTPDTGGFPRAHLNFHTPADTRANLNNNNNNNEHGNNTNRGGGTPQPQGTATMPDTTTEAEEEKNAVEVALRGLVLSKSEEEIRQDCVWQGGLGAARKADIMNQILAYSPEIKSFAVVFKGSSIVKVVHGINRYYGQHAPELNGAVLGRIGKWTLFSTPQLVQLPSEKTWAWVKVQVPVVADKYHAFHAKPENRGKLYRPEEGEATVEADLPILLALPAPAAVYASEQERTTAEMDKFFAGMPNMPGSKVTAEDVSLHRKYMQTAGSEAKNASGSWTHGMAIAEKAQAVTTDSDGLLKLMHTHMTSYLGQGPQAKKTAPAAAKTPDYGNRYDTLQSMPAMMNEFVKRMSEIKEEKAKKAEEGVVMTEFMTAALKGFAGVDNEGQLPVFYALLRRTKEVGDVRAYIMAAMDRWAKYNGIKIETNMFLPEETVKNIMKVKPNPLETVASSTTTDLGVSNMVCLPRKSKDIEERLMWEQAARETENNRTFREAASRLKGETRDPPSNFWQVEVMVATTAALMSVLYGERCPLYINLMKIHDILQENTVQQQKGAFTKLFCRQLTWAIYDDMRNFFSKRVMPATVTGGGRSRYPTSYMQDFFSNVMYQSPIHRSTFPIAWMDVQRQPDPTPPVNPSQQGRGVTPQGQVGQFGAGGHFGYNPSFQANFCQPVGTDLKHVHPIIRAALEEYHGLVERHSFGNILAKGQIQWRRLPKFPAARNPITNRDEMCWNYITGPCPYGNGCKYKSCHFPKERFTDMFATDLVNAIKTGVDAIVREIKWGLAQPTLPPALPPAPTPSGGGDGGPPSKKLKGGR